MLIIDAHLDLAWNALQWNRDLRQSAYTLRVHESQLTEAGRGQGTVALPELRQGRVAVCLATLIARSTGVAQAHIDYLSPEQAYGVAQGQLAYYRALEQSGHIRLITQAAALNTHWGEWQQWESAPETAPPPLGVILSMESADPIRHPEQLGEWQAAGVRAIGPAHYGPGRYAGGTGTELGLTPAGVTLLKEMERLKIVLDLTHFSDQAFWQALENFGGRVLTSHNNCRALVPHQRQFDDAQIRAIVARNGVIGMALDNWMIRPGWVRGTRTHEPVALAHVVDHIDRLCQLAGNNQHVAIGSDLDGGFGREQSPLDLDTIADLQKLPGLLTARGYTAADVAAIMHGNWLRFWREVWER